jgi:PAS domain S-box-containing protein
MREENANTQLIKELSVLREQLKNERSRFDIVLNSIVDGVYLTDVNKSITFWNHGAERITGYKATDVYGKTCKNLLRHVDEDGNSLCDKSCPLSETMDSAAPIYGKNVYSGTSWGRAVPVSVSCAPIIDAEGRVTGAVEVFRDISEVKELERRKSEFYSMITHDIKAPLTVILGYCELMLDKELDNSMEDIEEFATQISRSAGNIKNLVEDFLNISKMSSGAFMGKREPLVTFDMIKKVLSGMSRVAEDKDIALSWHVDTHLPVPDVDIKMIERALTNLVSNAIKYTPAGGAVIVSASASSSDSNKPHDMSWLEISVSDNGPGIPPEDQKYVFELYHRAGNTRGVEGTGLGLAIVKAVCEAHGGSVSLSSDVDNGSVFTMRLPAGTSTPS